jgi:hypothetical protein
VILLVITGTLATSELHLLERIRLPGTALPAVPSAAPNETRGPFVVSGPIIARTEPPTTEPPAPTPQQTPGPASPFTCEDREITDSTRSRWQLRSVVAGARRGFERVTFELARRGAAERPGRVAIEWMSPEDARGTFGLPRFDGQRGLLLTFGPQVTTTGSQLIGPVDLRNAGMRSVSGVYRFVDADGQVRAFIAIRDQTCARIRAAELEDEDTVTTHAPILVDLGTP